MKTLRGSLVLLVLGTSLHANPTQLWATPLGSLGGVITTAHSLNNLGQVVGTGWITGDIERHAFLWEPTTGVMTDLGTLGGHCEANGINDAGQVVGTCLGIQSGFIWSAATGMTALPWVGVAEANAINASGQVAGRCHGPFTNQAFLTGPGGSPLMPLPPPWGGTGTWGYGVNDYGKVVGYGPSGIIGYPAVVIDGRNITFLPTLPGAIDAIAHDINNHSTIVGESFNALGQFRPVIWRNGTITDLGTLGGDTGIARAINNDGVVVGTSDALALPSSRAFIWTASKGMRDLNTLLINPDVLGGTFLTNATDINDKGQIVANTVLGAFLLTPKK